MNKVKFKQKFQNPTFGSILDGQLFMLPGGENLYMRLRYSGHSPFSAVLLKNGVQYEFHPNKLVMPIERAEIISPITYEGDC